MQKSEVRRKNIEVSKQKSEVSSQKFIYDYQKENMPLSSIQYPVSSF